MEKKIYEYLKEKYKISDLEINDIKNLAPLFEDLSWEEFVESCKLLQKYGYPVEDLDFLILANPNIFVMSTDSLENDLKNLKTAKGDIETALKEDPYII